VSVLRRVAVATDTDLEICVHRPRCDFDFLISDDVRLYGSEEGKCYIVNLILLVPELPTWFRLRLWSGFCSVSLD
jgi:hypothetical protein